jgi:hypothetical protein
LGPRRDNAGGDEAASQKEKMRFGVEIRKCGIQRIVLKKEKMT